MGDRVLVAGLLKSGISAAKLLLEVGGSLLLYDGNDKLKREDILEEFSEYEDKDIKLILGNLSAEDLRGISLCIISPGIPLDSPLVKLLDELEIQIWSELQLAYHLSKGKILAITGTNGKTTTSSILYAIVKKHSEDSFLVGNIGLPFSSIVKNTTEDSIVVVECSSFQLETITDFRPDVSCILNITEDHLDRHFNMDNYIEIKSDISINQSEEDYLVLNYEDENLLKIKENENIKAKKVYFSSKRELAEGVYLKDDYIYIKKDDKEKELLNVKDLKILGVHNYENVMAAIAMALSINIGIDTIKEAVLEFESVEHRIEYVASKNGVDYYNDSKATNPEAAIKGLLAMPSEVFLIAGGYDKKADYSLWVSHFKNKVKYLVLIGQTRDDIAMSSKKQGFNNIMYASDMEEAVRVCASYASKGDCVLLSPACASFGMFKNFEERGEVFKKIVNRL